MPKRKKSKHSYLSDDYAAVQEGIEESMAVHFPETLKGKKGKSVIPGETGSYFGGQTGGGSYTYKHCKHDGSELVYEKDGKSIFGSTGVDLNEYSGNWDLIIDLANNVRPSLASTSVLKEITSKRFLVLKKFQIALAPKVIKSEVLGLDWPDMGIPSVGYDFWAALWEMLPATTVIACQGGHGRTGTCMAALMIMAGEDYWSAFDIVRDKHCKKAIESLPQEKYLHALYTGRLTREIAVLKLQDKPDPETLTALEEDLKYAQDNAPSNTTTSASKAWGAVGLQPTKRWSVQPNEQQLEKVSIQGREYIQECTKDKCVTWKCKDQAHVMWILPEDSQYKHMDVNVYTAE